MSPLDARTNYDVCPLYESNEIAVFVQADCSKHPIYHPDLAPSMKWSRCSACDHVFTEGYLTPQALGLLFGKTHDAQKLGHGYEAQRYVSARMVEKVARHMPAGCWLDVGFGNGSLLFTAEERGFHAVGIDLREHTVEGLRQLGFEAHCIDVADLDQPGRFADVRMADVHEHLPLPKMGLGAAHKLLQPGGVLFVSMPNSDSTVWRLLDANQAIPIGLEIENYHNFGRPRLSSLLAECGFQVVQYGISERYRACMEMIAVRQQ